MQNDLRTPATVTGCAMTFRYRYVIKCAVIYINDKLMTNKVLESEIQALISISVLWKTKLFDAYL